jgi:hypothetical protein
MLRLAIIVTTVLATALGSLGLPIYLHTCRMMAADAETAGCAMCDARENANAPVVPDDDGAGSCCGTEVVHQRVDDGTMSRAEMPLPLLVGVVAYFVANLTAPETPRLDRSDADRSPPALAARSQHSYLLNSTFLI